MRLNITTFINPLDKSDWPDVWALCVEDGQPALADGAIASGADDRAASYNALAAYWRREDEKAQAKTAAEKDAALFQADPDPHPADAWARSLVPGLAVPPVPSIGPRFAVDSASIKAMVEQAITDRTTLRIHYSDADGNKTLRLGRPSELIGGWNTLVVIYDVAKDAPRTLRLDRIERVEEALAHGD